MKEQHTYVKYTRSELDTLPDETDWERVDALTDEDIDAAASTDPDDPPTDESFWEDAAVVMPENMVIVDADPLVWFKAHVVWFKTHECFDRISRQMEGKMKLVEG